MIRVKVRAAATLSRLTAIQKAFHEQAEVRVYRPVAAKTLRDLVRNTPKGWTGHTRNSWDVRITRNGMFVSNSFKVMSFLERGTKAHGPKTKKMLFIPLTRRAAIGGWNPTLIRGKDYRLAKRVRGIKRMKIASRQRPVTERYLKDAMKDFIRSLIR